MTTDTRDAFGPLLERLQSEMRELRADQTALKAFVAARLAETETVIRAYVGARTAETDKLIVELGDRIERRLDQTERSVEERLTRIEARLEARP
jgi:prefoldin subunit 5